jgi:hypothetical protein|tara:strand:+ start:143 stop:1141 length:999 start_codon:yes stop_codon:yes gene_type:complete
MEEKTLKERLVHIFIISIFCSLYFLVATISMINSVAFFDLSHSGLMSWSLAIGFEIGAAASLAAIIILDKTNKTMVWSLFLLLTSFQMMANSFHAFINLEDYMGWIELFGLEEEEPIVQKRILSIVSGAILPVVALGFIKSLVDYIRPEEPNNTSQPTAYVSNEIPEINKDDIPQEAKDWKGAFDINKPIEKEISFEEREAMNEERMNIIGQNGNDGIHYDEIETNIPGSAEPVVEEIIPDVSEEQPDEDLYSRDANQATIPTTVGEVVIAPETVNNDTDNADDNKPEKPIIEEHITPVGDPIIIPTEPAVKREPRNIVARGFVRQAGESKP